MTKSERLQYQRANMALAFLNWAVDVGYESVKNNDELKIICKEQINEILYFLTNEKLEV